MINPHHFYKLYIRSGYKDNPCIQQFFCISNITRIVKTIDSSLSNQLGFPIRIELDEMFFFSMANIARSMPNVVYNNKNIVEEFSQRLINQQISAHVHEIQRDKLFKKYFLYQDRLKYLDYPISSHGRKRTNRASTNLYYTQNPDSRFFADFQTYAKPRDSKIPDLFCRYY